MDSYIPITFNKGYYAAIPNFDTYARPWSNGATTYLMPTCKIGDNYYTFFGYSTSSPYSYQNQGAYSCDAYKSTAGSPKQLTPVYTSFLDKLKTYYNLPLPAYQNANANNQVKPIFPMKKITDPSGFPVSIHWEIDWENTVYTSQSYIDNAISGGSGSFSISDAWIINMIDIPSSDDPSGGSTSDYSGIIGAITLIPATIICVCLFKMIFNVFMNRKVRG